MDVKQFVTYEKEKERAGAIHAFYIVLAIYVAVNVALFAIDYVTAGGPWFYWPLLGWSIGMLAFGVSVFRINPKERDYAEEQRIQAYIDKHPAA